MAIWSSWLRVDQFLHISFFIVCIEMLRDNSDRPSKQTVTVGAIRKKVILLYSCLKISRWHLIAEIFNFLNNFFALTNSIYIYIKRIHKTNRDEIYSIPSQRIVQLLARKHTLNLKLSLSLVFSLTLSLMNVLFSTERNYSPCIYAVCETTACSPIYIYIYIGGIK